MFERDAPFEPAPVGTCAGCGWEIYPGDEILEIAIPGYKVVHYPDNNDECLRMAVHAEKHVAVDQRREAILRR